MLVESSTFTTNEEDRVCSKTRRFGFIFRISEDGFQVLLVKPDEREIQTLLFEIPQTGRIAEAIGYSQPHVAEFLKSSGSIGNGEDRVSDKTDDSCAESSCDMADGVPGNDSDESTDLGRFTLSKERRSRKSAGYSRPQANSGFIGNGEDSVCDKTDDSDDE